MNNNKVAKIVSFIFPLIGLIIYAVNVGKNDKIAKDCLKWALIGMFSLIVVVIMFFLIMYMFYSINISKVDNPKKIPVSKITIQAKEIITEDMIEYISINSALVDNTKQEAVVNTDLIIGRKVNQFCVIPKGSMFYNNCLE